MKTPLAYIPEHQNTWRAALLEALKVLFGSDEIPPDILAYITKDADQEKSTARNSHDELRDVIESICRKFPSQLVCNQFSNLSVYPEIIYRYLVNGAVAIIKTYLGGREHYVLATKIDGKCIYLIDSKSSCEQKSGMVVVIPNRPGEYNRIVEMKRFSALSTYDYALGPTMNRQCIFLSRNNNK